ncbi:hypothetical protein TraAM80_02183 [Trypanosoma rangeli]|uniref:Wings apart-like protein C-terminal domain-containing protein n=1 Tax=Trypanosoma rangeli TaxID=5698 RepID=A0A3R7M5G0_TRYRA|nr:uncharacterized protein TraAM80_02183 [Trypanosoma rangeli]RNF09387.1 hypothetical protein TraAM80_02183 [Trypanosoma rangeli]|eukprot:RNF09387.1 hypothetical protein TraAM80_02183 [Trypanosoma rangeli]
MGKRKRAVSDVACFIEDIFSHRRLDEPSAGGASLTRLREAAETKRGNSSQYSYSRSRSRSCSESRNWSLTNTGSSASRVLKTPSGSINPSDSQRSTESAFATEMSFFCRAEEDLADMSLYLARVTSFARTPEALVALVEHFSKHGAELVMLSLKRSGTQAKLFGLLCSVSISGLTEEYQQLFLRFLALLVKLSDVEVLYEEELVSFLLQCCQRRSSAVTNSPVQSTKPLHWSHRARPTAVMPARSSSLAELKTSVNELCKAEEDTTSTALALHVLLEIVFRQNKGVSYPSAPSACLLFGDLGGFKTVCALLETEEGADALHLMEAVTLCEGLRGAYASELRIAAAALVRFTTETKTRGDRGTARWEEKNAALRVLTNVTGLVPSVLSGSPQQNRALAFVAANTLTDAEAMPDTLTFTLCLTTNIVKWEARENGDEFTSFLVEDAAFLTHIAALTFRAYHAEGTEKHVLAGYYALLLAVLSLCDSPKLQLRVPVMTAVAHATRGTAALKKVEAKPMTLIVAILQEFLLFQSLAGSLTRDSLLSMSDIIDSVVSCNGIEVSSDE